MIADAHKATEAAPLCKSFFKEEQLFLSDFTKLLILTGPPVIEDLHPGVYEAVYDN